MSSFRVRALLCALTQEKLIPPNKNNCPLISADVSTNQEAIAVLKQPHPLWPICPTLLQLMSLLWNRAQQEIVSQLDSEAPAFTHTRPNIG